MNNKSNSTVDLTMLKELSLGLFGFFGGYYSLTSTTANLIYCIISGASYFALGMIIYMKEQNSHE